VLGRLSLNCNVDRKRLSDREATMPNSRITVPQFALLAQPALLTRRIIAVHLHHTWRPRRRDFRGLATIEAMRRFHMEQGWSDIAQHLTIDPEGGLWTGRNWNLAPASATGHNGSADAGPFMIEMVGDFDTGEDPFDGAQRDAAIATVAHLARTFGVADDDIKFHNQLTNQKTCPGTGIERADFVKQVRALASKKRKEAKTLFRPEQLLGSDVIRPAQLAEVITNLAPPENAAAAAAIETHTRDFARDLQARARSAGPRAVGAMTFNAARSNSEWTMLRPHVINLAKGELSQSGEFSSDPQQLAGVVDAIRDYATGTGSPRVMIYAHGGLVSERSALAYAKRIHRWWLDHDVYPVFFIWETQILEILGQFILGRRDVADFTSDLAIEAIVKAPGTAIWAGMKESARLASSTDTGEGAAGGARLFASLIAPLIRDAGMPVYLVGHSAGAIFHAHFAPALLAERVAAIEHLQFLAPASRTELFRDQLSSLIGNQIKKLSMFTMEEEAEEQDNCLNVYRKSLLYLVSHACEGFKRRPILGLHRSLRKDSALRTMFGLNEDGSQTGIGTAELQLSFARGTAENPLTRALAHGDFDNDHKTMSSVLRRIIGVDDSTGIGEADFPFAPLPRNFDFAVAGPVGVGASPAPVTAPAPLAGSSSGGPSMRALCIGVNQYPVRPLDGCVNDAKAWGAALLQLGATVDYLFDGEATYDGMKAAIGRLVDGAGSGDRLILQYSGHGTQLPARVDSEADGFNEAIVPVNFDAGLLLVDDELADILRRINPSASITLFMDCCHSGTNSRFAPVMRARGGPRDKPRFMPLDDAVVGAYFARRGARALSRGDVSLPRVIHYAACQDHELAWESDGQGDFTGVAVPALAAAVHSRLTNEQFATQIAAAVGGKQRQHAQLMEPDQQMRNRPVLQ